MIAGVGIDFVEVDRMAEKTKKEYASFDPVFWANEIAYEKSVSMSAMQITNNLVSLNTPQNRGIGCSDCRKIVEFQSKLANHV